MDLSERAGSVQRSPWEIARYRFFSSELGKVIPNSRPASILDIGSGDAWFAEQLYAQLHPGSRLTCWDSEYMTNAAFFASKAWPAGMTFLSEAPAESFDAILMLDVLEHVEHDRAFLTDIVARNMRADGLLLVSVPAWPFLFSDHDVKLKHFRRYRPAECRQLLVDAGLRVLRSGGLFHSLLLARLAWVIKRSNRLKEATVAAWSAGPVATQSALGVLAADSAFSKTFAGLKLTIPGLSWWALCQKQSS